MAVNNDARSMYIFKVVVIGESGVGKTALLLRFIDGSFPLDSQSTIGVDFKIKTLQSGCDKLKLVIWDTAGQERYRALNKIYYRSANAVILVYDVTQPLTFTKTLTWLEEVRSCAHSDVLIWLVANKTDVAMETSNQRVSKAVGHDFAMNHALFFIETSARDGMCVDELFYSVAHELWTQAMQKQPLGGHQNGGTQLEEILRKNRLSEGMATTCCPI